MWVNLATRDFRIKTQNIFLWKFQTFLNYFPVSNRCLNQPRTYKVTGNAVSFSLSRNTVYALFVDDFFSLLHSVRFFCFKGVNFFLLSYALIVLKDFFIICYRFFFFSKCRSEVKACIYKEATCRYQALSM